MKKRNVIKTYLGFIFIIFGIAWSLSTKYSCESICYRCLIDESYPCNFLFLFIGLIFIIAGVGLIIEKKSETLKKKI